MFRRLILVCALLLTSAASCAKDSPDDSKVPVPQRVEAMLARMSLDEKLGQMTQAERGSITPAEVAEFRVGSVLSGGGSVPSPNTPAGWADMIDAYQSAATGTPLGIPILYGVDAVHGHNNVLGATIFPHNIGLGASRDPALAERIGRATAREVAATGIHWTFSPCLCVARDIRWGRTYESFGENPEIAVSMTTIIRGYQTESLANPAAIMATAKHYLGDGGTTGGKDQGDAQLSESELRAVHLPPFKAAIEAGVGSVMASFSSWNGDKVHGSEFLLTKLLKEELGFTGFVVSDWNGIDQIDGRAGLSDVDVRKAVNAGIDMAMQPESWREFIGLLRAEVQAGRVPVERIDDANRRILTKKFELGLFERAKTDRSQAAALGSDENRELAREAVAKSLVLLKNDGAVLPIRPGAKIFVAGKNADDIGNASGGWTIQWQGRSGPITPGTTILQGIKQAAGPNATVTFAADGTGADSSYDVAIAVVGEYPYAEYEGDRPGGVVLDSTDKAALAKLAAAGVPIVTVMVSGRPVDVTAELGQWRALVAAWLPGTEGAGVADVLFGRVPPSGKLPVTWSPFAYGSGLTYP
jgi:beta-glucosidase